jgi:hypothetical protein
VPSSQHESYQAQLTDALRRLASDPDRRRLIDHYDDAIVIFYNLDLEAVEAILASCYARSPRGGKPWEPLAVFRSLLLGHLIAKPRFAALSQALRGCPVLRAIAGFSPEEEASHTQPAPGTSTFYDFCNRLLDGPCCPQRTLTETQQLARQVKTPRNAQGRRDKKDEKADKKGVSKDTERVSEKLRKQLLAARDCANPDDLNTRLGHILLSCAVVESARRGLLGDISQLPLSGDGSPLPSAADGGGRRDCDCDPKTRCDCPRLYSDPTATWGYDSYRKIYYFGHHFYELGVYRDGVDLPLHVRIDPARETDHTAAMKAMDWLGKALRDDYPGVAGTSFIGDAGHDGMPMYRFCQDWSMSTVIPLSRPAPASHPSRGEVKFSDRGVPLCQANVEMTPRGTAGKDCRPLYLCPLRANKIARCPLAPDGQDDWHCTGQKYGPVVTVAPKDDLRLFPQIPRNSARYKKLYRQRSGTERSNFIKKYGQYVLSCRHRRSHLWHIRLAAVAVLQHAKAWCRDIDSQRFIADLLGEQEAAA